MNSNELFATDKRAATIYKAAVTDQHIRGEPTTKTIWFVFLKWFKPMSIKPKMRWLFLLTVACLFISETFQYEPVIY